MKSQVALTEAEKETLMQLCLNHRFKEVRKRAMGLLMLASGKKIATVRDELDTSAQSIYNWIAGWSTDGIVGLLKVNRHGGRHTKMPEDWMAKALELVEQTPYSVKQLAQVLETEYGQQLPCSLRTLARVLKAQGMTYKRIRMSLKKT